MDVGLPVLIGVTSHHIEAALERRELLSIVRIEVEEQATLTLIVGGIDPALLYVRLTRFLEGIALPRERRVIGDDDVSLTRSVVVAEVDIELKLGEEVELVVDLQIADRAEDVTDILLLIEERHGVTWSQLIKITLIHPSPVATEGSKRRAVITDRTRGVELYSGFDSILVGEAVVRSTELDAGINGQVIVEETRIDAQVTADTVHLVGLQDTLLVVEARRHTVRHLASSTADAEVVVTTVGELIDLVLPVGISRTELTSFSRSDALDEGAVFISREQTYTASSLREGVLDRDSDLRLLPYLTTLGGDHDDPVGSARTIDSGSGSILEDVHRSDVLRVE